MKQLLTAVFVFINIIQPASNTIRWTESTKLEWKDFKARPTPTAQIAARTAAGIRLSGGSSKGDTVLLTVAADFDPSQSWVKKEAANPYILDHEQLHFDIYELYCRKLRKTLMQHNLRKATAQSDIQNFAMQANKDNNTYQLAYDKETNHSINVDKQKEWILEVRNELELLKDFKDPVLKLVAK